jgi:hypothetical protein
LSLKFLSVNWFTRIIVDVRISSFVQLRKANKFSVVFKTNIMFQNKTKGIVLKTYYKISFKKLAEKIAT